MTRFPQRLQASEAPVVPGRGRRMRSALMRGPSRESTAGSKVTERSREKSVTSRPATPIERCSESGIVSSAAKLIETGKAESRIVQPARRAASSAACRVPLPSASDSRKRLTVRSA